MSSIKALDKSRLREYRGYMGKEEMNFLVCGKYLTTFYFSVLSIAFIDVANLFADFACTCHCRMHFVCINVNKLVQMIEGNTRKKGAVKIMRKKNINNKFS